MASLVVGWIATHNVLVRLEERVAAQWRQVENQLERRRSLVPAIASLAAAATHHEQEVLESVAALRATAGGHASSPRDAATEDARFVRVWGSLEAVPELVTTAMYLDVQAQLEGTESRLATERRRYNAAARAFNTRLRTAPWRFFAIGFEPVSYYGAAGARPSAEDRST